MKLAALPAMLHILLLVLFVHTCHGWSPLYSSSPSSSSSTDYSTTTTTLWFPRNIQESVNYKQVVPSLYVRQIVVETYDMARMAVQLYLESQEEDPFGSVAQSISVLPDAIRVGWIHHHHASTTKDSGVLLLPSEVQKALFETLPKMGDVHILPSDIGQYHVVKVDELAILHRPSILSPPNISSNNKSNNNNTLLLGSHVGINAVLPRSKLKGQGVIQGNYTLGTKH